MSYNPSERKANRQLRKKPENIDSNKNLFVINTLNNNYTLHINDGRCCHIRNLTKWEDFETEQLVIRFANNNYKRCRICFPEK